ncbi:U32 family peptidase [Acidocella sp.]|uniref:ubiquinone anaerobic biosynthesis protein UbiV n=1 Tax=Acidocella sp. TaxID=50710 RepID=UPI002636BDCF|nr:U32 family peptidase [Acidocella sp.]
MTAPQLTLGPLLFHWPAAKWRDFYFRIADEAEIDCVYVGEVVCAKREPLYAAHVEPVLSRLAAAGKQIVRSTLAVVTDDREMEAVRHLAGSGALIEVNDAASLHELFGRPHVIGPYINVFNEGTYDVLTDGGAVRVVLPVEVPMRTVGVLATGGGEIELQVFGRQPLSVAMRCYHARSHGLTKDSCQFVCGLDHDGQPAQTIDGREVLSVNGTQTLSSGYMVHLRNIDALRQLGVTHFRLSPQDIDMVGVARLHRATLTGVMAADEAEDALRKLTAERLWQNGFLYGQEGMAWVERAL